MRKHRFVLALLAGLLVMGALFVGAVAAQQPTTPTPNEGEEAIEAPPPGVMGRWFGRAMGRSFGLGVKVGRHVGDAAPMIDAVAEVTGLSADEVRAALADGQPLNDIITGNGATVEEVVDAYIAGRVAALQEARPNIIERVQQGFPRVRGMMAKFADVSLLDVVADLTGQTVADVRAALADGATFEEIITEGNTTVDAVVAEFLARREATLGEWVEAGRITQEQADALLARVEEQVRRHIEEGLGNCPGGFAPGALRGRMFGPRGGGMNGTLQRGGQTNGVSI